ncbi:MAG TPA: SDR family NAD(P)-dependent oxidoreductase [Xanthobacteraceae bacterium]|nr:SDR family NAD(P)-dependent oxidoreductase [Xanthobacteraceae bacterium]
MTDQDARIAWVTGGGTGIGKAGAAALAADGWTVIISGRRGDALDEAAAGIADEGGRIEALTLDVSDAADAQDVADEIVRRHGRIDLLVNSAGVNIRKRGWSDMDLDGWNTVVDINLTGLYHCMRAVLPTMRAQQDGCVINIASWAGRFVSKVSGAAYTTVKHGVVALTHSFNQEEFRNGLRACCICPAEVATEIMKQRPVPVSDEDLARMLQPDDLGRTIAFVANMPRHVCVNEVLISPTWNRSYL